MDNHQDDIRRIFSEAADLRGEERAAYLSEACGPDHHLRASVERLLKHDAEVGSFMDTPALDLPVAPTMNCLPAVEQPGTMIGRYKLLQEIGKGGMGVVYMAEQREPVRRKVALKIIKPGMDTREVTARFEAERQALAMMNHPNIAKVHDGGATESGRPYFVMELVHGIPLTEYCDQNQLTTRERLELFVSVCQAVQHAHQKGVIHRDIKPSNVMVTLHDHLAVPKIIDFGVAKATNRQLTEKTLFTGYGQIMGTPLYMSPEQAQMSGLDVDTRTDIYSLGALLYELLTGTTPFDRKRIHTSDFEEVRRLIREEDPARPSARIGTLKGKAATTASTHRKTDLAKLRHSLRGELDWIVMKALEKDRTRRYATAESFALDVKRYLNDEPVEACPPSAAYRFRKFFRRNRSQVMAVGTIALTLVIMLISGVILFVENTNRQKAEGLVNALLTADIEQVPKIVQQIGPYRRWADAKLKEACASEKESPKEHLHAALALLPLDPSQVDYLKGRLLVATPNEVTILRDALLDHKDRLIDDFWRVLERRSTAHELQILRAASALAAYDLENERWEHVSSKVTNALVSVNPMFLGQWTQALRPVRASLLPHLAAVCRNLEAKHSETEQSLATNILQEYAADQPETLADLLMDADPRQFAALYPKLARHKDRAVALLEGEIDRELKAKWKDTDIDGSWTTPDSSSIQRILSAHGIVAQRFAFCQTMALGDFSKVAAVGEDCTLITDSVWHRPVVSEEAKETLARRQANAAVALLRMGQQEEVWPLLKHSRDPRVRSWIIHRLRPMGADSEAIANRLAEEPEVSIRRALILSLGEFATDRNSSVATEQIDGLLDMYRDDPDPGIHGAAEWLLRQWNQEEKLEPIDEQMATGKVEGDRSWYMTNEQQTMVIIPRDEFMMGSPESETDRDSNETLHRRRIDCTFAISSKEVTVQQFQRFLKKNPKVGHFYAERFSPEQNGPQTSVLWYEAAAYCNWLSRQERIPEDQWCYAPNDADQYAEGMKIKAHYLDLGGYRLPTEAEWEYACRAGALTGAYYGDAEELLPKYAWYADSSEDRAWPVGSLKPNDLGLFDTLGNVWEWCQEGYYTYSPIWQSTAAQQDTQVVTDREGRLLRGGSFLAQPWDLRCANRLTNLPPRRDSNVGFRLARTFR